VGIRLHLHLRRPLAIQARPPRVHPAHQQVLQGTVVFWGSVVFWVQTVNLVQPRAQPRIRSLPKVIRRHHRRGHLRGTVVFSVWVRF
jgi:hypothetical protein